MKHINPPSLSRPRGYTHVVEVSAGRTIYVSGQVALDAEGRLVGKNDVAAQTRQVFDNLTAALAASGAGLDAVVKITVFMTDVSEVQVFRDIRDTYFGGSPPASSLVQVSRLVLPELLVEVEAIAVIEGSIGR
jgi:reactive intermediate/imine deaminase